MTPHPCRCETCANYQHDRCLLEPYGKYEVTGEIAYRSIPTEAKQWFNRRGCLSHPKAREYLMKDVIEELNHKKMIVFCSHPHVNYGYKEAIKEAIALIREGVRK